MPQTINIDEDGNPDSLTDVTPCNRSRTSLLQRHLSESLLLDSLSV
jgi:hypothetical protein